MSSMPSAGPKTVFVNITTIAIFKILAVFLIIAALYILRDVVVIFFVSLVLATIIDPLADIFARKHIPRALAVLTSYILIFGLLAVLVVALLPPMISEINELIKNFPLYWDRIMKSFVFVQDITAQYGLINQFRGFLLTIQSGLAQAASGFFATVTGIFGGLVSFFAILVLTFYLVIEEDALRRAARMFVPESWQPYLSQTVIKMQEKIGHWLRGQIILSLAVGALVYIGLLFLGVKFALVLALIAAITEIIPYVGPWIGAIPAVFLAFAQSPLQAALVALLYLVIQQVENNFLVPKVMQRVVGLNPVVSILALLIGARLGGIFGALLAIPVVTALSVFAQDLSKIKTKI